MQGGAVRFLDVHRAVLKLEEDVFVVGVARVRLFRLVRVRLHRINVVIAAPHRDAVQIHILFFNGFPLGAGTFENDGLQVGAVENKAIRHRVEIHSGHTGRDGNGLKVFASIEQREAAHLFESVRERDAVDGRICNKNRSCRVADLRDVPATQRCGHDHVSLAATVSKDADIAVRGDLVGVIALDFVRRYIFNNHLGAFRIERALRHFQIIVQDDRGTVYVNGNVIFIVHSGCDLTCMAPGFHAVRFHCPVLCSQRQDTVRYFQFAAQAAQPETILVIIAIISGVHRRDRAVFHNQIAAICEQCMPTTLVVALVQAGDRKGGVLDADDAVDPNCVVCAFQIQLRVGNFQRSIFNINTDSSAFNSQPRLVLDRQRAHEQINAARTRCDLQHRARKGQLSGLCGNTSCQNSYRSIIGIPAVPFQGRIARDGQCILRFDDGTGLLGIRRRSLDGTVQGQGLAVRVIHCPGRCPRRVFQNVIAIRAGNGLAADRKRIIFHVGVASAANGTVRADDAHTSRQGIGIDRQRIPLFLRPLKLDLFQVCAPIYKARIQSCHTGRNGDALKIQASKKS